MTRPNEPVQGRTHAGFIARAAAILRDACVRGTLCFVSDTRALILTIVGTGLAVITSVVTVLSMQIAGVNTRIDDVRSDIDDVRSDIRDLGADHVRFEQRLDAVEVVFGKVEQRLETLERVFLPSRDPDD